MNNLIRKRCWISHKYKEDWEFCPICHAPLRWIYADDNWTPCDREAVTYTRDLDGKLLIYDGKELLKYCSLYKNGDKGIMKMGLLPHIFSCDGCNGYHGTKIVR